MSSKIVFVILASIFVAGCTILPPKVQVKDNLILPNKDESVEKADINIQNFAFFPDTVSLSAGQIVTVVNNDSVPHSVTSDDGKSFDTGLIDPGRSSSFMAPVTGTYGFHCSPHPNMKARLTTK